MTVVLDGRTFPPTHSLPPTAALLLEGDCLTLMALLPSRSVHLILCDLPYGTTQNAWDSVIPLAPLWEQYARVLAPGGNIVLTAQGSFTARLILSREKWFRYKMVWEKSKATNWLNVAIQPMRKHEDILVYYPRRGTYNPQMGEGEAYDKGVRKAQQTGSYGDFEPTHVKREGGRCPTDVIYFPTAEAEGAVIHPTQKPVALARYLVRTYSNPGDVVLDNAFGSGSFPLGAVLEGRRAIGMEMLPRVRRFKNKEEQDMLDLAAARIEAGTDGGARAWVPRAPLEEEAKRHIAHFLEWSSAWHGPARPAEEGRA